MADHGSLLTAPLPDSRQMCFEQGKALVCMRDGDDEHIFTEWESGVVDREHIATGATTRYLPDGRVITVSQYAPLASSHSKEIHMTKTPDTYTTTEEAVTIIAQGVRGTGCIGRGFVAQGWETLLAMRDDVSPEVFERGVRAAYPEMTDEKVERIISEVDKRGAQQTNALLGTASKGTQAPVP